MGVTLLFWRYFIDIQAGGIAASPKEVLLLLDCVNYTF